MIVLHGLIKMAVGPHVFAALLVLGVQQCFCQESRLTINPSNPTLTSNVSDTIGIAVTISCQPPSSVSGTIYNMIINRSPHSSTAGFVAVANIATGGVATTTLTGATVTADISVGGSRTLTLTMPQAKCADSGQYECQTTTAGPDGVGANQYSSTSNLTIEVSPGLIVLTPTPSGISNWVVNNTLTILCNGIVGTADDTSRIEWNWDYMVMTSQGFPGTWRNYDGPTSDIVAGNLVNVGSCYKRQSSTLTRNLQIEDTGRTYRCWVRNLDMNGDYSSFAQEVAVGTVTATATGGDQNGGGDGGSSAAKADVGAIVGGIIGALIVIAIIVVIIFFVMRRRKAQKNAEYTSDKPADEAVPPYTTTADPSPAYALPNRHKGRDERERSYGRGQKSSEGLHYADLELVRNPPTDDSDDGLSSTRNNAPTEYASIRLF